METKEFKIVNSFFKSISLMEKNIEMFIFMKDNLS